MPPSSGPALATRPRAPPCTPMPRLLLLLIASALAAAEVGVVIEERVLGTVDERLFGQFLERPSWGGETGPEAAVDAQGDLPVPVVEALAAMRIPIVRFPGGTDVDYSDWTDLIDLPGRAARPRTRGHKGDEVGNRFGLLEYGRLADRLGWRSILVVNLLDGMAQRRPLAEAARRAADLVAYARLPVGAALPAGMTDWPALRAAAGRPAPLAVDIIQLGNEWWLPAWPAEVRRATGLADAAALAAHYRTVLHAYVAAIRAVDPEVELMIDAEMGGSFGDAVLADEVLRREVRWAAMHDYAPGDAARAKVAGAALPAEQLTAEAWWRAATAMPGGYDRDGRCTGMLHKGAAARRLGYRLAVTEWNWNGWSRSSLPSDVQPLWRQAQAVGTGGFLLGMLRDPAIGLATQSMLVGGSWDIAAIRREGDAFMRLPQAQVTDLFSRYHGRSLIAAVVEGAAVLPQPIALGWAKAPAGSAEVDVVVTGDAGAWYLHVVVRRRESPFPLAVTLPVPARGPARVISLLPTDDPAAAGAYLRPDEREVPAMGRELRLELPPAAVSVVVVPR